ncbi:MAG: ATP-binding domain-containing protein, partial [Deltaproteobacteria bacterium]|nr:ATP-binding domain-containing protein [Deltaproteobacteria bacterium]
VESFATGHAHRRIAYLGEPARNERGFSRPKEDQLAALAEPYVAHFTLFDSVPEEDLERTEPAPYPANVVLGYAELLRRLRRGREWNPDILTEAVQRRIFAAFERYRVLATHREGPLGVSGLERALAERVRKHIHGEQGGAGRFWVGRPVLVTENAYDVRLMNGDVGLILPVRNGTLAVHFPTEHGLRAVATSRLPPHEGALAMTVHKSQGSQFDRIALVLAGRNSPIQTRELVYTGVTRAKNQLAWLGTREELEDALGRTVARTSGLGALLREPEPAPAS